MIRCVRPCIRSRLVLQTEVREKGEEREREGGLVGVIRSSLDASRHQVQRE
jgi:hypothetical protein